MYSNNQCISKYARTLIWQLAGAGKIKRIGFCIAFLGHLIVNTSFSACAEPNNTNGNEGNSDKGVTVLETMVVESEAPRQNFTGPGYYTPTASTATKTVTEIMETPYSVSIVHQAVLKDQQVIRLGKALQNISGVNMDISNAGLADGTTLRGFVAFPFRDGFRFEDQNSNGRRDMANIERIEVLKGPGSILYGQAEPGGIINLITKKPLKQSYHALEQQFGSFGFYRTTVDVSGPINADLSYRLNLAYENAESFRDFVEGERFFIAPVLRWDVNPSFQINFELDYLHGQNIPEYGIPARGNRPVDVPNDRFFGEPFNKAEYDDLVFGVNWSYAINDRWLLKHRFNAEILKSKVVTISTPFSGRVFSDSRTVFRILETLDDARNESYYNAINLIGNFETWGSGHTIVFGADYYREDTRWGFVDTLEDIAELDIFNPVYQQSAALIDRSGDLPGDDIDETEDWFGFYLQDQIELPYHLHVLAGFRYDNIGASGINNGTPFNEPRDDAITPRLGLLWRPFQQFALYGSYTENFSGSNGRAREGGLLPPESARQWEIGFKTELWDERLIGTLAYYDLTKQNVAVPDPINTNFSRAIGELRIRGIELEIAGEFLPGWRVIGAYAYTPFAKIIKDLAVLDENTAIKTSSGNTGRRFDNVPHHNGSLWTTYEFGHGVFKGLKLGAGVVAVSSRYADIENTALAPGYAITNVVAAYEYRYGPSKVTLQVNIDNLFDKEYFASTNGLRFIPGTPRAVLGSIRVEF